MTQSHVIAFAGLKKGHCLGQVGLQCLATLMPLPPRCWDHKLALGRHFICRYYEYTEQSKVGMQLYPCSPHTEEAEDESTLNSRLVNLTWKTK